MGDWVVPAPLIVALLIALVYAGLIAAHARLIRRDRRRSAYEPRAALWLASRFGPLPPPRTRFAARAGARAAAPDADGLAAAEWEAIEGLLRGELERSAYRAAMADVAARAAVR
ncbi:hypothetical protein ACPPVO_19125 [Dactylosporangium sp. McL0621]|uniref:hypothetical protein n=1 Tax=Dactylosporangium sp. McL0621 TaxID=3415678 RepID=UPI003CF3C997